MHCALLLCCERVGKVSLCFVQVEEFPKGFMWVRTSTLTMTSSSMVPAYCFTDTCTGCPVCMVEALLLCLAPSPSDNHSQPDFGPFVPSGTSLTV